jgi:hypothetical protein
MKMDPGKCFSPAPQAAHGPATSLTESVHLSPLFPRWQPGPTRQNRPPHNPLLFPLWKRSPTSNTPPRLISRLKTGRFNLSSVPIKPPHAPLSSPFGSSPKTTANPRRLLAGSPTVLRPSRALDDELVSQYLPSRLLPSSLDPELHPDPSSLF